LSISSTSADSSAPLNSGRRLAPLASPAATVMLLRDGEVGIEVLLLRRGSKAPFFGGTYVFPGGLVDNTDNADLMAPFCGHLDDARASELLDVEHGGLAFWVAAIRECYEEAGIFLARQRHSTVPMDVLSIGPSELLRVAGRRPVTDIADVCSRYDLVLLAHWLHPVSHWVSPTTVTPRYDTWFFVAPAPQGQTAVHDPAEIADSRWIAPNAALQLADTDEMALTIPIRKNLELLRGYATTDAALEAMRRATPLTIVPRLHRVAGTVRVLLPGDVGYDSRD
jgi:8-oxo-dGTP pyrophosphatase MutT (NUDIX family)